MREDACSTPCVCLGAGRGTAKHREQSQGEPPCLACVPARIDAGARAPRHRLACMTSLSRWLRDSCWWFQYRSTSSCVGIEGGLGWAAAWE